jgi:sugar phosphate isomerase/epimerase
VIEVGCQTYSLRAYSLAEMLACARKAGFRAVELWVGHADHAEGVTGAARARRLADEVGITIQAYSVGGFLGQSPAVVAEALESAFAFARALGIDLLTGVLDRRSVPLVDGLCRRSGLRFALENHWYAELARGEDLAAALDATSPLVGAALDTGHVLAAGQRPLGALALLGERVLDVHLKDVVVPGPLQRWVLRRPRMEGCTVGAGDGEIERFLGALVERGYAGRVALEDERSELPLSELQASLRAATAALRAAARPAVQAAS